MKFGIFIFVFLVGAQIILARPAQIILLRHAEKPEDESNLHLSAQGKERAQALVQLLTATPVFTTNGLPAALFATQLTLHGHSRRPKETLEPLAKHLKLPIQTPYPAKDYAKLAERVLHDSGYDGKTVVICWVHDFLPQLAHAFGAKPKPADWKHTVFDRVLVITFHGKKVACKNVPQHLLPGDSTK